ncbi:class I SAM-dependent methyltransferase [Rhodospirillum sp. A1_3_36]|uniref:class I SAM-dependent methyltransferase n=1 Tax=Rhodospirillum sp. A1_3_36 TaxID=3391666 RepID=UPI0039A5DCE4
MKTYWTKFTHSSFIQPLRLLWRALRHSKDRETILLRLRSPPGLFQPDGHTTCDRYPICFKVVCTELKDQKNPRLLSFGCSTGEEVFSLARLLTDATVRGLDINRRAVDKARLSTPPIWADRISFAVASSTKAEPSETYDAVLAMAVFRHCDLQGLHPQRCDHRIRFADFAQSIEDLARCIKPGGLLVLRNSHFRFSDTATFHLFQPVLTLARVQTTPPNPIYGPDNRLILDAPPSTEGIWRKHPTP